MSTIPKMPENRDAYNDRPDTPKPRAGEHVPEFGCNRKTLYAIADTMIEKLRGCGESAALVRQAIDERDLLRERERELVEALEQVRATGYKKAGGGFWMIPNETIELVRAALAKHGR